MWYGSDTRHFPGTRRVIVIKAQQADTLEVLLTSTSLNCDKQEIEFPRLLKFRSRCRQGTILEGGWTPVARHDLRQQYSRGSCNKASVSSFVSPKQFSSKIVVPLVFGCLHYCCFSWLDFVSETLVAK